MDAAILSSAPFLAELSDEERATIAPYAAEVRVVEGKCLVAEGDYSYDLLVVEVGEAEVTRGGERVAEVGPARSSARWACSATRPAMRRSPRGAR